MIDSFVIEPWQVETRAETLVLRELATARRYGLGAAAGLSLSLALGSIDFALWQRSAISGTLAGWLGLVCLLLLAKGVEQLAHALRRTSKGPRTLIFRRLQPIVEIQGCGDRRTGHLQRIEIDVTTWTDEQPQQRRKVYTVRLVVDDQPLDLGKYGAEASANRLAGTIGNFVELPVSFPGPRQTPAG